MLQTDELTLAVRDILLTRAGTITEIKKELEEYYGFIVDRRTIYRRVLFLGEIYKLEIKEVRIGAKKIPTRQFKLYEHFTAD